MENGKTGKEIYEERKAIRKAKQEERRKMAEKWQEQKQMADETAELVLSSVKAFFEGKASLEITPFQSGAANGSGGKTGFNVRFKKDGE